MQTNIHVGRLLKEFELQTVGEKQDIKMVRFGLAVQHYLSKKARTDFIYYVAFGKTAEILYQYGNKKGMPMEVHFDMRSARYEKDDGQTQYRVTNVLTSFMPWATNQVTKEDTEKVAITDETGTVLQELADLNDMDLEIH